MPYYPGYRAFLDGAELPVRLMNALQVAVLVPPGAKGQLHLVFLPKSLVLGCGVALAGVLLIVGVLLAPLFMRRSPSPRFAAGPAAGTR